MKLLWISHFVPYPPVGGCYQRSYNLIARVGQRHEVHLIAVRHKSSVNRHVSADTAAAELRRHCRTVDVIDLTRHTRPPALMAQALRSLTGRAPMTATLYERRSVRDAIARRVAATEFQVVHLDTIGLASHVRVLPRHVPWVLNHHNAESAMMRRRVAYERNPLARQFYRLEAAKLREYERTFCPQFDANLVVSRPDADTLRAIAPSVTFDVIANGVDVDYFRPGGTLTSKKIVFAGRLDQYANRDGILHFVRNTWPLLTQAVADAELTILGDAPPDELVALARTDPRIKVRGFVEDIRPYFHEASAAIIPLRDGGGTRLKVIDAMALGMPIVTTSLGVEGLDVRADQEVLVADTPATFAQALARVLMDEPLRRRLAAQARARAEDRYSWDSIARCLEHVYKRVADQRAVCR